MQQESDTVKIFLVKTTVSNFVSSLYVIYIFSVIHILGVVINRYFQVLHVNILFTSHEDSDDR